MPSLLAISRLEVPSAISRKTSFSRVVKRSSCVSTSRRLFRSWAMLRGVNSVPPSATVRIASTTSWAARDLWMKALAPASSAAKRAASLSSRVRKMSLVSGRSWRIPVAASAPVPSVSLKSIKTRSGLSSAARAIDSETEPECPITVMSSWSLMSAARPSATTWWSSTMSTRVVALFIPVATLQRHPELDRRAKSRLAFDLVPSPREESAFVKREQAEMSWQATAFGDHKATAVVLHDAAHPAVLDLQRDPHEGGRSVLLDVGQGLGELAEEHRPVVI